MPSHRFSRSVLTCCLTLLLLGDSLAAQLDSTNQTKAFDSELLRLKVPEAFQKSSLKLEIFADSSWQIFRGHEELSFEESLNLLGLSSVVGQYEYHLQRERTLQKEYRSRRVFSTVTALGGSIYLVFVWNQGWVNQIPGYAALAIAAVRYLDSRKLEIQARREQYFQRALINPSEIQRLVDDYNFRLYQFLSTAGIQFREE